MDDENVLVEDEYSPYVQEPEPSSPVFSLAMLNPLIYIDYLVEFIATYGWLVVLSAILAIYPTKMLLQYYKEMQEMYEEAEYNKDPNKQISRMEHIQRAREAQQRRLQEASDRALEQQREREEQKRAEALERLEKYGKAAGQRLGGEDDYMPLSAPASTSSYRPPKRSSCGGGGCGR